MSYTKFLEGTNGAVVLDGILQLKRSSEWKTYLSTAGERSKAKLAEGLLAVKASHEKRKSTEKKKKKNEERGEPSEEKRKAPEPSEKKRKAPEPSRKEGNRSKRNAPSDAR